MRVQRRCLLFGAPMRLLAIAARQAGFASCGLGGTLRWRPFRFSPRFFITVFPYGDGAVRLLVVSAILACVPFAFHGPFRRGPMGAPSLVPIRLVMTARFAPSYYYRPMVIMAHRAMRHCLRHCLLMARSLVGVVLRHPPIVRSCPSSARYPCIASSIATCS